MESRGVSARAAAKADVRGFVGRAVEGFLASGFEARGGHSRMGR